MARRSLITDEERRLLFGVPGGPDALARHYTWLGSHHGAAPALQPTRPPPASRPRSDASTPPAIGDAWHHQSFA